MANFIGKLVEVLPTVTGVTASGEWQRLSIVLARMDNPESKVVFTAFGKSRVDSVIASLAGCSKDDIVSVVYEPESREFGARWYTDLRCLYVGRYAKNIPQVL